MQLYKHCIVKPLTEFQNEKVIVKILATGLQPYLLSFREAGS